MRTASAMPTQEPMVQLPPLDTYSDQPLFNTKAVVRQTGVPAPTLRAWERRYGILLPLRGDNDYRLYSERDIATVIWLRERVRSGMTISQAIALLKTLQPARRRPRRGVRIPGLPEAGPSRVAPSVLVEPARETSVPARVCLEELQGELLTQFAHLDDAGARHTIALALNVHCVEDVCERLLTPVLYALGQKWAEGSLSCTVEHFGSTLIRAQLESLFRATNEPEDGPLMLVGCAPGEMHEIGPLMLALILRRGGMRVAYLGQNIEAESLVETARAARPAAVVLSTALPRNVAALQSLGERLATVPRPRPLLAFGGQAFASNPALAAAIAGVYLSGDGRELARELKARLNG